MTGNTFNFEDEGDFFQDMDTSNTVDGKSIYYLINQKNLVVDPYTFPQVGCLYVANSTNVLVKDLNLTKYGCGVLFAHTTNSIIRDVHLSEGPIAISLSGSYNNTIYNNVMTKCIPKGKNIM